MRIQYEFWSRRSWKLFLPILTAFAACGTSTAQTWDKDRITNLAENELKASVNLFREFLRIPNNGRYTDHIQANVEWCQEQFRQLDFEGRVLTTEGAPLFFAEKIYHPGAKSILFYLQIDGQPVDSAEWDQESPYEPVLKVINDGKWQTLDWPTDLESFDPDLRIFARSASDSKGPAMAFVTGLRIIKQEGYTPDFNIKVIADFQEELGSPSLPAAVAKYRDLLDAEMMLILDGTRHLSNLPTLTFGARGIVTLKLKVFGATRDLHSGQYGNFAPNPAFHLARLLGAMKDEQGRVAIPGYYEGIELDSEEKMILNNVPEDLEEIKKSLGISAIDNVGATYQEALQYPSLNIRGLQAGWVDEEVRTIIPAEATAEIDIRLVPESDGPHLVDLIRQYIIEQGFHIVGAGVPTEAERAMYPKLISFDYRLGSLPFRTDLNSPVGTWLGKAMFRAFGDQYVRMRTTGGSQPIAPFITTLGIPAVSIRIPNPDNSIHAPNENLRLGNYLSGIQMCLAILTQNLE